MQKFTLKLKTTTQITNTKFLVFIGETKLQCVKFEFVLYFIQKCFYIDFGFTPDGKNWG